MSHHKQLEWKVTCCRLKCKWLCVNVSVVIRLNMWPTIQYSTIFAGCLWFQIMLQLHLHLTPITPKCLVHINITVLVIEWTYFEMSHVLVQKRKPTYNRTHKCYSSMPLNPSIKSNTLFKKKFFFLPSLTFYWDINNLTVDGPIRILIPTSYLNVIIAFHSRAWKISYWFLEFLPPWQHRGFRIVIDSCQSLSR